MAKLDYIPNGYPQPHVNKRYDYIPHGKIEDPRNPDLLIEDKKEFKEAFVEPKDPEKTPVVDVVKNPKAKVMAKIKKPIKTIEPVYNERPSAPLGDKK